MNEILPKLEQNLTRVILLLLFFGCLLVRWPFVTALLWASVLSFWLWALNRRLFLGGRHTLAALLMSMAMMPAIVSKDGMIP